VALLSLVCNVVIVVGVDRARPGSECVVDIGGSEFHPGEIGR
jgi:hypothetical protein